MGEGRQLNVAGGGGGEPTTADDSAVQATLNPVASRGLQISLEQCNIAMGETTAVTIREASDPVTAADKLFKLLAHL
jgi:hypothetical protein